MLGEGLSQSTPLSKEPAVLGHLTMGSEVLIRHLQSELWACTFSFTFRHVSQWWLLSTFQVAMTLYGLAHTAEAPAHVPWDSGIAEEEEDVYFLVMGSRGEERTQTKYNLQRHVPSNLRLPVFNS